MGLEDLEQLRLEAKLTRESLGANYSRYLELLRHAELAEKVMEIDDPRQKYSALSHLIDKIVKDLPGEIIKQLEVLLSNHTLRFSDLCSDILPLAIYGGTSFSHCVTLLSHNRKELEQWECDDEATIVMRKEKLIYYKDHLIVFEGCDTPNSIYYRDGAYREYDEHKNSYYYRLGRMIQTHDADGCSLEITMQMACFYVALSNERSLVEDELMLKGEDIQMEWNDNMIVEVIEHLANFDYAVGTDGDSYDRYLAAANLLKDNINGFVTYCQERHNSPQFQPMMIAFRNGINATIKSAERLGKMFANTMSNAPKLADVYYPGLECCHELVETCKRYKFWIDSFLPEPSSPEDEQAAQSPLPPSAEATTTEDATLPDFSQMNSYTPTIKFEMSALYSFLVAEGVIDSIDENLFANCITHAHINEIWSVGNHHKLKCVFRHLKDHFPNDWIDIVAQRMDTTRKIITAFDRSKIGDFEMRLRNLI